MKKRLFLLFLVGAFMLASSNLAFADPSIVGDIDFGEDTLGGHWGFVYRNYGDESDEHANGTIEAFFNIKAEAVYTHRFNRSVDGEYYEGGTPLTTVFGGRLGANYSPYAADTHENDLGVRVYGMNLLDFDLDAAYIFDNNDIWSERWHVGAERAAEKPFALNAKGNITQFLDLDATLLYYGEEDENEDVMRYSNLAVSTESPLYRGLDLNTQTAYYGQTEEYLYEVNTNYELLPGLLDVRAKAYGNNIADINADSISALIDDMDPLEDARDLGDGYGTGFTLWYDVADFENELNLDLYTTNPDKEDDDRMSIEANLKTEIAGYTIEQAPYMNEAPFINIYDEDEEYFYFYSLGITTPENDFRVGNLNPISYNFRYDFDYDQNYYEEDNYRLYNRAGVFINTEQDLGSLKGVELSSIAMLDMPDDLMISPGDYSNYNNDIFKFGLMGKYTAPNGVEFRVQYFSSQDYASPPEDGRGDDRYENYRWHTNDDGSHTEDDRFGGLRMIMAVPF